MCSEADVKYVGLLNLVASCSLVPLNTSPDNQSIIIVFLITTDCRPETINHSWLFLWIFEMWGFYFCKLIQQSPGQVGPNSSHHREMLSHVGKVGSLVVCNINYSLVSAPMNTLFQINHYFLDALYSSQNVRQKTSAGLCFQQRGLAC